MSCDIKGCEQDDVYETTGSHYCADHGIKHLNNGIRGYLDLLKSSPHLEHWVVQNLLGPATDKLFELQLNIDKPTLKKHFQRRMQSTMWRAEHPELAEFFKDLYSHPR